MPRFLISLVITFAGLSACGGGSGTPPTTPQPSTPLLILGFGDSLTAGLGAAVPYPQRLQTLLTGVYTKGSITITNGGQPGELASAGVNRMPTFLNGSTRIVLIMEGVNDLNAKVNNPDDPNDLESAVAALTSMVRAAKAGGRTVAIATLPPQRPGWLLLSGRPARSPELVPSLNDRIRQLAGAEGVLLADVAASFNGDLSLIGGDGLHPTQAGYDRIAETFFNAIRSTVAAF